MLAAEIRRWECFTAASRQEIKINLEILDALRVERHLVEVSLRQDVCFHIAQRNAVEHMNLFPHKQEFD